MDNIAPTVCCTVPDAVRCARHELKQLKPRDFSDLLEFVASDSQSPTADHRDVSASATPRVASSAATPRESHRLSSACSMPHREGHFPLYPCE